MRICRWMRRGTAACVLWLAASSLASAAGCADVAQWLDFACRRVADTYRNGSNELLLSGYSWHAPWTWTAERRAEQNELAWGGGLGRTLERDNGDTEMVYALVFSHSHSKPQYNVGYAWSTYWGPRSGVQAGLGFTAALVQRNDIANGWPFPAVLPIASLRYDRVTLWGTFIPTLNGGVNHGSVFYFFGSARLD